jgi:succinate dehydrogenase/fumarate reductase flavoprotein subunit
VHVCRAPEGRRAVAGAFAYDRERGRSGLPAKAIVLATGGVGRAFKITCNSWEYTGDGHALAYHAGAELMDMEFVQFHPTGMVWPPSVRGILVTEGVRGEGGVLRNAKASGSCSRTSRTTTAPPPPTTKRKAGNTPRATSRAAGRPELLTRDHVRPLHHARGEGRARQPARRRLPRHRLDQAAHPERAEHIRKKLPSMYHQFKELAGLDITTTPMEVGPTTHYIMGGVRVDGDSQMSRVPGCSPPASAPPASTAPTASAATRCRTCWSSASGRGSTPRSSPRGKARARRRSTRPRRRWPSAKPSSRWSDRRRGGESPYAMQYDLQDTMQDLVGIVRREDEMQKALAAVGVLWERAKKVAVPGNREYNPGWHAALDLPNLLTVSEAITLSAIERKESRGGHFRDDLPDKDPACATFNIVIRKATGRPHGAGAPAASADAARAEADHRGQQVMAKATFRIWRGDAKGGGFKDYACEAGEGWVVLDAVLDIQAKQANDLAVRWNCKAGKCGSCSAEINGKPRLMCMTRLEEPAARSAGDGRADERLPVDPGSRHRRVVELPGQEGHQAVQAAAARRPRTAPGAWRRQTSTACRSSASASSASCARTSATSCATTTCTSSSSARASWSTPPPSRCTRSTRGPRAGAALSATASACATSPSAAPRSAPSTSPSPTTPSSRSRSGWWTASSTPQALLLPLEIAALGFAGADFDPAGPVLLSGDSPIVALVAARLEFVQLHGLQVRRPEAAAAAAANSDR